jgi:hypothetical protein
MKVVSTSDSLYKQLTPHYSPLHWERVSGLSKSWRVWFYQLWQNAQPKGASTGRSWLRKQTEVVYLNQGKATPPSKTNNVKPNHQNHYQIQNCAYHKNILKFFKCQKHQFATTIPSAYCTIFHYLLHQNIQKDNCDNSKKLFKKNKIIIMIYCKKWVDIKNCIWYNLLALSCAKPVSLVRLHQCVQMRV